MKFYSILFRELKYIGLCSIILGISACSTSKIQLNKYALDIYGYQLNESEFKQFKQNMFTQHSYTLHNEVQINILNKDAYWKMLKTVESNLFYSTYRYEYLSCNRNESSQIFINSLTKHNCSYIFNESGNNLNLQLLNFTTKDIQFNLNVQRDGLPGESQTFSYMNAKQFMLFYLPESTNIRLFIINQNLINLPWTFFNKSPQADNQLRTSK